MFSLVSIAVWIYFNRLQNTGALELNYFVLENFICCLFCHFTCWLFCHFICWLFCHFICWLFWRTWVLTLNFDFFFNLRYLPLLQPQVINIWGKFYTKNYIYIYIGSIGDLNLKWHCNFSDISALQWLGSQYFLQICVIRIITYMFLFCVILLVYVFGHHLLVGQRENTLRKWFYAKVNKNDF